MEQKVTEMIPEDVLQNCVAKFKALGDRKRLQILHELCQRNSVCVCDLTDILDIPQSSISYHLKILTDAKMIVRENHGTWSYYRVNPEEMSAVLSDELCSMFRPND